MEQLRKLVVRYADWEQKPVRFRPETWRLRLESHGAAHVLDIGVGCANGSSCDRLISRGDLARLRDRVDEDDPDSLRDLFVAVMIWGSGTTNGRGPRHTEVALSDACWRRLAEWQEAGVWRDLQQVLLDRLRAADRLDFSRATIDASHVQAKRGRSYPKVGPSPVDRGRPGSKHHVLTDGGSIPSKVSLTGGHRNDVTQLLPLVDSLPSIRGRRGRPRRKPRNLYADRGYDHDVYRRRLREPKIARRRQPHGSGLGRVRWVAESAIAHLHGARRLRTRWETRDDMHDAFLQLAHCMTLARRAF